MFSSTPDGADDRARADRERPISAVRCAERFGGWFVTGSRDAGGHLGNRVPALEGRPRGSLASVAGLFDPDGYRAASSDIAALLTFSHQTHMTNLLTRASWEARAADPALHPGAAGHDVARCGGAACAASPTEVVDYMLFVDEAPLPGPVRGGSGFAERMSARGPRDRRGRSLYELDLDAAPAEVSVQLPDLLAGVRRAAAAGEDADLPSGCGRCCRARRDEPRYRSLSRADRQAVVEILKDTKPDLPAYFTTTAR